MDDRNPYAPSRASLAGRQSELDVTEGGAWSDGKLLVTVLNGSLPDRCVKCNEPADEPTKIRKVYWHHPALYLLVIISWPIYLIVGLIVRKKAFVPAGLCVEHKKRRRTGLIATYSGLVVGIAGFAALVGSNQHRGVGVAGLFGVLAMFVAVLVGVRMARVVYARKIDKQYSWQKGCGQEFLNSLPPFPG